MKMFIKWVVILGLSLLLNACLSKSHHNEIKPIVFNSKINKLVTLGEEKIIVLAKEAITNYQDIKLDYDKYTNIKIFADENSLQVHFRSSIYPVKFHMLNQKNRNAFLEKIIVTFKGIDEKNVFYTLVDRGDNFKELLYYDDKILNKVNFALQRTNSKKTNRCLIGYEEYGVFIKEDKNDYTVTRVSDDSASLYMVDKKTGRIHSNLDSQGEAERVGGIIDRGLNELLFEHKKVCLNCEDCFYVIVTDIKRKSLYQLTGVTAKVMTRYTSKNFKYQTLDCVSKKRRTLTLLKNVSLHIYDNDSIVLDKKRQKELFEKHLNKPNFFIKCMLDKDGKVRSIYELKTSINSINRSIFSSYEKNKNEN